MMNRSAKDGARSSLHYGDEGAIHSPIVPRCLRAARYGRFMCDPRRTCRVPEWQRDKRLNKRKRNGERGFASSRLVKVVGQGKEASE